MATEPLALLDRALDQTERVIAGIRPDQAHLPTPCSSWDVRALVGHLVDVLGTFAARARGESPGMPASAADPGDDWPGAFRARADELLAAWQAAGDLDRKVDLGIGELPLRFVIDQQVTECAAHTWDLVTATGQRADLDPEIAEHALDWARGALQPAFRGTEAEGKAFGPEVQVPADAPAYDRLAAFFGRQAG